MFTGHCDGIRYLKINGTLFSLSTPHVATQYLFHCAPLNTGWFRKKVRYIQVTVHRDKFGKINQLDASISKNYCCHKTLHVSGIFSAHHQEFSTLHSALVSFMLVSDDRFQAESGWNCVRCSSCKKLCTLKPDSRRLFLTSSVPLCNYHQPMQTETINILINVKNDGTANVCRNVRNTGL